MLFSTHRNYFLNNLNMAILLSNWVLSSPNYSPFYFSFLFITKFFEVFGQTEANHCACNISLYDIVNTLTSICVEWFRWITQPGIYSYWTQHWLSNSIHFILDQPSAKTPLFAWSHYHASSTSFARTQIFIEHCIWGWIHQTLMKDSSSLLSICHQLFCCRHLLKSQRRTTASSTLAEAAVASVEKSLYSSFIYCLS